MGPSDSDEGTRRVVRFSIDVKEDKPRKTALHSFVDVDKGHLFWNANIIVKFFMLIFSPLLLIFYVTMYWFSRHKTYTVLKNSEKSEAIRQICEGVWIIQGFFPGSSKVPLTMGVVRLPEGGLMLWSTVFGHEDTIAEVKSLGEDVKLILSPNGFHDSYIEDWRIAFPEADIICPETCVERTEKFTYPTGTCEDVLPAHGVEVISHCHITREPMQENCYIVPMPDGKKVLLTSDIVCTVDAFSSKEQAAECQHPLPFIPMFVPDTKKLSDHVRALSKRDADVLVPLHGPEVLGRDKIKAQLEEVADADGKR